MSNSHTKFGRISFDSITDCDDARENLEIFFRKFLLAYRVCWFNLDVLFIYSKENCIIWHLLAAFIKCTGSTGIPRLE